MDEHQSKGIKSPKKSIFGVTKTKKRGVSRNLSRKICNSKLDERRVLELLKSGISQEIKNLFVVKILQGIFQSGDTILVDCKEKNLVFHNTISKTCFTDSFRYSKSSKILSDLFK